MTEVPANVGFLEKRYLYHYCNGYLEKEGIDQVIKLLPAEVLNYIAIEIVGFHKVVEAETALWEAHKVDNRIKFKPFKASDFEYTAEEINEGIAYLKYRPINLAAYIKYNDMVILVQKIKDLGFESELGSFFLKKMKGLDLKSEIDSLFLKLKKK